jgi:hypothetical protein
METMSLAQLVPCAPPARRQLQAGQNLMGDLRMLAHNPVSGASAILLVHLPLPPVPASLKIRRRISEEGEGRIVVARPAVAAVIMRPILTRVIIGIAVRHVIGRVSVAADDAGGGHRSAGVERKGGGAADDGRALAPWLVVDQQRLRACGGRGGDSPVDASRQRERERNTRRAHCERENGERRRGEMAHGISSAAQA